MNSNESVLSFLRHRLAWALATVLIGGLALTGRAYAQDPPANCGLDQLQPCPGTVPAIWPDRSAARDNEARILGWNLQPLTEYEMVIVSPDSTVKSAVVTTDEEGDLLGDNVREDGHTWGSPFEHVADPQNLGVYEVRVYVYPWSGDVSEPAVAATTFFHNDFGN